MRCQEVVLLENRPSISSFLKISCDLVQSAMFRHFCHHFFLIFGTIRFFSSEIRKESLMKRYKNWKVSVCEIGTVLDPRHLFVLQFWFFFFWCTISISIKTWRWCCRFSFFGWNLFFLKFNKMCKIYVKVDMKPQTNCDYLVIFWWSVISIEWWYIAVIFKHTWVTLLRLAFGLIRIGF